MADHSKLAKEGRNFDCSKCPKAVQKIRRCREERENFTSKDGAVFPIYVQKGGEGFGFCPAKAFWDQRNTDEFNELLLIAELKVLPRSGGLNNQDQEIIDKLAWFIPRYEIMKFSKKVEMVLGDTGASQNGDKGRDTGKNRGRR